MARVAVQTEPFDPPAELAALSANQAVGGIGCFIGQVRGDDDLAALTVEHYPGMTERGLAAIAAQAEQRWQLCGCTLIHRIGRLPVGAPIVLVIATSQHRAAALDATSFLIDWLKTDAAFWKCSEYRTGRRAWVEARPADIGARDRWREGMAKGAGRGS